MTSLSTCLLYWYSAIGSAQEDGFGSRLASLVLDKLLALDLHLVSELSLVRLAWFSRFLANPLRPPENHILKIIFNFQKAIIPIISSMSKLSSTFSVFLLLTLSTACFLFSTNMSTLSWQYFTCKSWSSLSCGISSMSSFNWPTVLFLN